MLFSRNEDIAVVEVNCVSFGSKKVIKHGQTEAGDQRYRCKEHGCGKTFKLSYRYKAREHGVKDRIVDMALNGSGVRDTARDLSVAIGTVITTLKKSLQPLQNRPEETGLIMT